MTFIILQKQVSAERQLRRPCSHTEYTNNKRRSLLTSHFREPSVRPGISYSSATDAQSCQATLPFHLGLPHSNYSLITDTFLTPILPSLLNMRDLFFRPPNSAVRGIDSELPFWMSAVTAGRSHLTLPGIICGEGSDLHLRRCDVSRRPVNQ